VRLPAAGCRLPVLVLGAGAACCCCCCCCQLLLVLLLLLLVLMCYRPQHFGSRSCMLPRGGPLPHRPPAPCWPVRRRVRPRLRLKVARPSQCSHLCRTSSSQTSRKQGHCHSHCSHCTRHKRISRYQRRRRRNRLQSSQPPAAGAGIAMPPSPAVRTLFGAGRWFVVRRSIFFAFCHLKS
jgi:hypothetical protein